MYRTTAVQTFLNQVPAKELGKDKEIYQPGAPRLKACPFTVFGYFNVCMCVCIILDKEARQHM